MGKGNRDLKQMIEEAEGRGWVITITNGNHYRWQHPNGGFFFSAYTPSDHRAIKNMRSNMRKVEAGLCQKR